MLLGLRTHLVFNSFICNYQTIKESKRK